MLTRTEYENIRSLAYWDGKRSAYLEALRLVGNHKETADQLQMRIDHAEEAIDQLRHKVCLVDPTLADG